MSYSEPLSLQNHYSNIYSDSFFPEKTHLLTNIYRILFSVRPKNIVIISVKLIKNPEKFYTLDPGHTYVKFFILLMAMNYGTLNSRKHCHPFSYCKKIRKVFATEHCMIIRTIV